MKTQLRLFTHDNYTVETTTNASITHTINGKLKAN